MKLNKIAILFLLLFLSFQCSFSQDKIARIEPPNWWAGMNNSQLQLLVYGTQISDLTPTINYEGVTIQQIIKVENSNYLFIDLNISKGAKAGKFDIQFLEKGKVVETDTYELKPRDKDAAMLKGFDNSDVLYLITPDRFANGDPSNDEVAGMLEKPDRSNKGGRHGGDIEGIRQRLDYLKDMGFTAIWLNPVLENDQPEYSYHGYATTDFYKVDQRFGSNESYRQLCKEANEKGIKVIMDMIVNHCGHKHWWMDDLPTKDWINSREKYGYTNHRKTVIQDPYSAEIDKAVFSDGWFVETMPDMNARNPLFANYLTQMSIWWIEFAKISGIRMDTYPYPDMDYMADWTEKVMAEYPNFNIVGEEWFETSPSIVAYWQKGKNNPNGYTSELKSLMDFPLRYAVNKALTIDDSWNTGWITLYEMLAHDFVYANPNDLVIFPDNHDMARFYAQVGQDYDLFKLGITFFLTTRGVPQIYYGTEILVAGPEDGDHGLLRSDFPGGWKGDEINGFTGEGLTEKEKEGKAFMKKLLNWRKTKTSIHTGKLKHFIPENGVYVYFRYNESEKIMVILNKNEEDYQLDLSRFSEMLKGITKGKEVISEKNFDITKPLDLPVKSALILELD